MVREFLEGIPPPSQVGLKGAFNMDSLLREMRELEMPEGAARLPIQPGPNVAHYAFDEKNWADEFLRKETHVIPDLPSASGWSQEFLDNPGYMGDGENYIAEWENQWDALTHHLDNPLLSTPSSTDLAQTAGEIVGRMQDPKFAQSEVT